MGESVRFDRAIEYYDRTRALTPSTEAEMVRVVSKEVGGRGRVLEIGVGTGRIALPLRDAGVDVTGLDLSLPMLRKLRDKDEAPVVQGDATRLPFRSGSFGAAIAVHVLHLIPDWEEAVAELLRAIRPGGVVLVSQGAWNLVAYADVIEAFASAAAMPLRHAGLNDEDDLDRVLGAAGATPRDLARIGDVRPLSLREMAGSLRDGIYSFTWGLDEATRRSAADEAESFAAERHGDLDEVREVPTEMYWRAYDLA